MHVGGFDENFCSWGSEDIDLGYRISKLCKIGFINKMHGFHIPHIRDVANNELSNMKNTTYMLQKYNTWEFEVLQNFYGYGSLSSFEKVLNRMRLLTVSGEHPSLKNGEIVIDIISQQHPFGRIFAKNNELKKVNSYWGIVVPFDDFYFNTAYVSDHVFIYPHLITSRILQEALRVSKRVLIFPTSDSIRIPWDEEKILLPKAPKQHIHYGANDLLAFTFLPAENNFLEVTFIKSIKDTAFL